MKKELDKALLELKDVKRRVLDLEQKVAMMPTISLVQEQPVFSTTASCNTCPTCGSVQSGSDLAGGPITTFLIDPNILPTP